MLSVSYKERYTKKVLREVHFHSEDKYIENEIRAELEQKFGTYSDVEIKNNLPSPKVLGFIFRQKYRESAHRPEGIFPQFFVRLLRNLFAPILELITVLIVFRLFPVKLIPAVILCTLSGIIGAFQQHVKFCKGIYLLSAFFLPPFLLLWYPLKSLFAGTSLCLSIGATELLFAVIGASAGYLFTTAVLHILSYAPQRSKFIFLPGLAIVFIALAVTGGNYLFSRYQTHIQSANRVMSQLSESYDGFCASDSLSEFSRFSEEADSELLYYHHLYESLGKEYPNSFSKLADLSSLYRTAISSEDEAYLFNTLFEGYDPLKGERIDLSLLSAALELAENRFSNRIKSSSEKGTKGLFELASAAQSIYEELYATADKSFSSWIFQNSK